MAKLDKIEGIGFIAVERFHAIGINSMDALLIAGRTKSGRKALAQKVKVTERRIAGWVNRADLARVKGIGAEYADLLEAAGVQTVPDLAEQVAETLHKALHSINRAKKLVKRVPSISRVEVWITLAKELPAIVEL